MQELRILTSFNNKEMVMDQLNNPILFTLPGAAGGTLTLDNIATILGEWNISKIPRIKKKLELRFANRVIATKVPLGEAVLRRIELAEQALNDYCDSHQGDVVLFTHSGGGIVARGLISKLQANNSPHYHRLKYFIVRDGIMQGAFVSPSILFLDLVTELANGSTHGKNGIKVDVDIPDEMTNKFGRGVLWYHTNDLTKDALDNKHTNIEGNMSLHSDSEHRKVLAKFKEWETGINWGEGIVKVAFSNGGTKTFWKKTNDSILVNFVGYKLLDTKLTELRISLRTMCSKHGFMEIILPTGKVLGKSNKNEIRLSEKSPRKHNFECAPGSYYSRNIGDKSLTPTEEVFNLIEKEMGSQLKRNDDKCVLKKYSCYVPTVSSLFLKTKNPLWPIGKSDAEIRAFSMFDYPYWTSTNSAHGHPQWNESIVNWLVEGINAAES